MNLKKAHLSIEDKKGQNQQSNDKQISYYKKEFAIFSTSKDVTLKTFPFQIKGTKMVETKETRKYMKKKDQPMDKRIGELDISPICKRYLYYDSEATQANDTVTQNSTTNQKECTRYTWKLGNKLPYSVYSKLRLNTDILIVPSDGISVANAWTDGTMVNASFKMNQTYDANTGTLSFTGKFYKTYSKQLSFGSWTAHVFYMN